MDPLLPLGTLRVPWGMREKRGKEGERERVCVRARAGADVDSCGAVSNVNDVLKVDTGLKVNAGLKVGWSESWFWNRW